MPIRVTPHSGYTKKPIFLKGNAAIGRENVLWAFREDGAVISNDYYEDFTPLADGLGMSFLDVAFDIRATDTTYYFEFEILSTGSEYIDDENNAAVFGLADLGMLHNTPQNKALGKPSHDNEPVSFGISSIDADGRTNNSTFALGFENERLLKGDVIQITIDTLTSTILFGINGAVVSDNVMPYDETDFVIPYLVPAVTLPPGWSVQARVANEDLLHSPYEEGTALWEPNATALNAAAVAVIAPKQLRNPTGMTYVGYWDFVDEQGDFFDIGTSIYQSETISRYTNIELRMSRDLGTSDAGVNPGHTPNDVFASADANGYGYYVLNREPTLRDGMTFTFTEPFALLDVGYIESLSNLHHNGGFGLVTITPNGKFITSKRVAGGIDNNDSFLFANVLHNWYQTFEPVQNGYQRTGRTDDLTDGVAYGINSERYQEYVEHKGVPYNRYAPFSAKFLIISAQRPWLADPETVRNSNTNAKNWRAAIARQSGKTPSVNATRSAGFYWYAYPYTSNNSNTWTKLNELVFYDKEGNVIPYKITAQETTITPAVPSGFGNNLYYGNSSTYGVQSPGWGNADTNWGTTNIRDTESLPTNGLNSTYWTDHKYSQYKVSQQSQYYTAENRSINRTWTHFVINFEETREVHAIKYDIGNRNYDGINHSWELLGLPSRFMVRRIVDDEFFLNGDPRYPNEYMAPLDDTRFTATKRTTNSSTWNIPAILRSQWWNTEKVSESNSGWIKDLQLWQGQSTASVSPAGAYYDGSVPLRNIDLRLGDFDFDLTEPSYINIILGSGANEYGPLLLTRLSNGVEYTTTLEADPDTVHPANSDVWFFDPVTGYEVTTFPAGDYRLSIHPDYNAGTGEFAAINVHPATLPIFEETSKLKATVRRMVSMENVRTSATGVQENVNGGFVYSQQKASPSTGVYAWTPLISTNRARLPMSMFQIDDLNEYSLVLRIKKASIDTNVGIPDILQLSSGIRFGLIGEGRNGTSNGSWAQTDTDYRFVRSSLNYDGSTVQSTIPLDLDDPALQPPDVSIDPYESVFLVYAVKGDNLRVFYQNKMLVNEYISRDALRLHAGSVLFPNNSTGSDTEIIQVGLYDKQLEQGDVFAMQSDPTVAIEGFGRTSSVSVSDYTINNGIYITSQDIADTKNNFITDPNFIVAHNERVAFTINSGTVNFGFRLSSDADNTEAMQIDLLDSKLELVERYEYDPDDFYEGLGRTFWHYYDTDLEAGTYYIRVFNPTQRYASPFSFSKFTTMNADNKLPSKYKRRRFAISFNEPEADMYRDVLRNLKLPMTAKPTGLSREKMQFVDGTYGVPANDWGSITTYPNIPETLDAWTFAIRVNVWRQTDSSATGTGIGAFARHKVRWQADPELPTIYPDTIGIWGNGVEGTVTGIMRNAGGADGEYGVLAEKSIHQAINEVTPYGGRVLISLQYEHGTLRTYVNDLLVHEGYAIPQTGAARLHDATMGLVSNPNLVDDNVYVQEMTMYDWALSQEELLSVVVNNQSGYPVNTLDHYFKSRPRWARYVNDNSSAYDDLNEQRLYDIALNDNSYVTLNATSAPISLYNNSIRFRTNDRTTFLTLLLAKVSTVYTALEDIKWIVLSGAGGTELERIRQTKVNIEERVYFRTELQENTEYEISMIVGTAGANNRSTDPTILEWGFDYHNVSTYEFDFFVNGPSDPPKLPDELTYGLWDWYEGTPWNSGNLDAYAVYRGSVFDIGNTGADNNNTYTALDYMPEHLHDGPDIKFEYEFGYDDDSGVREFLTLDMQRHYEIGETPIQSKLYNDLVSPVSAQEAYIFTDQQHAVLEDYFTHKRIEIKEFNPFDVHVGTTITGEFVDGTTPFEMPIHKDMSAINLFDASYAIRAVEIHEAIPPSTLHKPGYINLDTTVERAVRSITIQAMVSPNVAQIYLDNFDVTFEYENSTPYPIEEHTKIPVYTTHISPDVYVVDFNDFAPNMRGLTDQEAGGDKEWFGLKAEIANILILNGSLPVDKHEYAPDLINIQIISEPLVSDSGPVLAVSELRAGENRIAATDYEVIHAYPAEVLLETIDFTIVSPSSMRLGYILFDGSLADVGSYNQFESGELYVTTPPNVPQFYADESGTTDFETQPIDGDWLEELELERPIPDNYYDIFALSNAQFEVEIEHPKYYRG